MSKIAVVILNWNGKKMLEKFLPSVIEHSSPVAEVIVADNGSTDDSTARKLHFLLKMLADEGEEKTFEFIRHMKK